MAFTTTLSTARRAVRFFGTVHAQVDALQHRVQAVRQSGALLITPDRFPAVLATSCVTGLIVGWQIMDRIYNVAEQEHLEKYERDNPERFVDYRARAMQMQQQQQQQRRSTIADADPRMGSLWTSSVE